MSNDGIFIDWLTVYRTFCGLSSPLPAFYKNVGLTVAPDGRCLSERVRAARVSGSWSTSCALSCDGSRIYFDGNIGRFGRPDNLFNRQWNGTKDTLDELLRCSGLPSLGMDEFTRRRRNAGLPASDEIGYARIRRIDITANFASGSLFRAAAVIRHLQSVNLSRRKKGLAGDESVWWSSNRVFIKAYRKGPELQSHGLPASDRRVQWANDNGIIRVEVELRRRYLDEEGIDDYDTFSQACAEEHFSRHATGLEKASIDPDSEILASLPARTRAYASAWMAGQDLTQFVSRMTLYRHAKPCRELGFDITEPRVMPDSNVVRMPLRFVDLERTTAPEWYEWTKEEAA